MINFVLVNSEIAQTRELPISAAGRFGFQQYTPLLDAEYLLYGRTHTKVPTEVSVGLDTGSISPIVFVRALLRELSRRDLVSIKILNLGLEHTPDSTAEPEGFDRIECESLNVELHQRRLGVSPNQQDIDKLTGVAHFIANTLSTSWTDNNIIAECVPGGTTSAELLMRINPLLNTLSRDNLSASSSEGEDVPKVKNALVSQLLGDGDHLFQSTSMLYRSKVGHLMDYLQLVLTSTEFLANIPEKTHVTLAGGTQMAAIMLALECTGAAKGMRLYKDIKFKVDTTKWVVDDPRSKAGLVFGVLESMGYQTGRSKTRFDGLKDPRVHKYEEFYTKEGCGLGAVLCLAERHLNPLEIRAAIERELESI